MKISKNAILEPSQSCAPSMKEYGQSKGKGDDEWIKKVSAFSLLPHCTEKAYHLQATIVEANGMLKNLKNILKRIVSICNILSTSE